MRWVFCLIQLILVLQTIYGYQVELPNYEILKSQKILSETYEFIQPALMVKQINEVRINKDINVLNRYQIPILVFEMFLYPYRIYSYFDESNKKQYLMKRIDFNQFREINKQKVNIQLQSIIEKELNLKQCLFSESIRQNNQNQQTKQNKQQCLQNNQLYQLLPDLLTIFQQQHEQLQLQKINDEYILVKNHADLQSKHELKYYLNLDLYRMNVHSYIHESRFILIRYLFEQKTKQNNVNEQNKQLKQQQTVGDNIKNIEQNNNNNNKYDNNNNKSKNIDNISNNNKGVQVNEVNNNKIDDDNNMKIKIKDYLINEQYIWKMLFTKDTSIFTNLFNYQTSISLNKNTKYDYLTTINGFYLAQINHKQCPLSTHDFKFKLFSSSSKNSQQQNQYQSICTYLTIHKIYFIQFQLPQPIEYASQQKFFLNVQKITLGLSRNNSLTQQSLLIHIQTKSMNIQIIYGKSWKQIKAQERPKSIIINQDGQLSVTKTLYLQNYKVQTKNNSIILYKQSHKGPNKYIKDCSFNVVPYILTVQKINNQFIVVCAQGSNCMILNKQCKVVKSIILENAFGVQWNYKINYLDNKILSYILVSRRSDYLIKALQVPIDQIKLQYQPLKTGLYHNKFQYIQLQPGVYQIKQHITNSQIYYHKGTINIQITPIFTSQIISYHFKPLQILSDSNYQSFSSFKSSFLDYILRLKIIQKFNLYYFPNITNINPKQPIQLVDITNQTQFQNIFDDCSFDPQKQIIHFKKQWKACKIILKTNSLLLAQPIQLQNTQNHSSNQLNQISNDQAESSKTQQTQKQIHTSTTNKIEEIDQVFANQGQGKNLLIVCSAHKNSPAFSKCKVSQFHITQNFHDWKRKAKFFFEGGRYFQLYFFNQNFMTANNESFLQLLQKFSQQFYNNNNQSNELSQVNSNENQNQHTQSQLKQYKILYTKQESRRQYDIKLIDYEKQQIQNVSRILLITICILFPTLTICCCLVCFKSHFQNILIYYGVINAQPSFRYPLNKLALKIKMKQLSQNGYVHVHKNKKAHHKDDQLSSDLEIKFSAQCCFCLEELQFNQSVAQLYCKHQFHSKCFIQWVKNQPNTKCPLCKRNFTKSALNQFKSKGNNATSPTKPIQQFSQQNQNYQYEDLQNQLQLGYQS